MIYLSNLDIHIFKHNNKQHVLRPRGGWWLVAPTCSHPAPGNGHPRHREQPRDPNDVYPLSGSVWGRLVSGEVGNHHHILGSLSWGLLSMSCKWIHVVGGYLNATICDMHLYKFSHKPHSKWEDQLFISCQLRWTVSNFFFLPGPWVLISESDSCKIYESTCFWAPECCEHLSLVRFLSATFQTIPVLSEVELVLWSAASVREWCR